MDPLEEMEDVLLEMEQEPMFAGSFTWASKDYVCLASSRGQSKRFGEGGWSPQADLVIFVRNDLFEAATPAVTHTLVSDGRKYRIDDRRSPQGSVFIKLVCSDASRAA